MSHHAIIKRDVIEVKPQWFNIVNLSEHEPNKVIDMQDFEVDKFLGVYILKNAIIEVFESNTVDYLWEGIIEHDILNVGDKLNLGNDTVTIIDIEKNIDGSAHYRVESVTVNCDNYDELLKTCKVAYDYTNTRFYVEADYLEDATEETKTKKSWFNIFK